MLNQIVLVGRIVEKPTLIEKENKKYWQITLAVNRSFKNEEGIYETDFVPIVLWQGIAENVVEYCNKGDIVGAKGRIEMADDKIQIVAEKITFLSNKKEENKSEEN